MTENVTTFRVRFTLASGTLFRKRFLGSARLQRGGDGILLSRTFELRPRSEFAGSKGKFVATESRNQHATVVRPQKAFARAAKRD